MKTDEELMQEYRQGSEEAFLLLYEKYSPQVYGFIKKRLRESLAEDFYQKVWRQLHEKRSLYNNVPFAPWFFVLIRNLLIDEYRSLGRKKHEYQDDLIETLYGESDEGPPLDELLGELPEETRDLVRKHYLEGLSYQELSQKSGLSQTNLRQRLSRALRGLRKSYEE